MVAPNKSLGQHWLKNRDVLSMIADAASIRSTDTVIEIGPGLGTLTSELLKRSKNVIAVEYDTELAKKLPAQFPGTNLSVISSDILSFDLSSLPDDYVVVANVPYYITSKIVQMLMTANNKPRIAVLLVQKEVAERLAAEPGHMGILSVSAQVYAHVRLGDIVPAALFTPPPKVDSRVIILETRIEPFLTDISETEFFRVVKAGFSSKRKKLRSSLSGGLSLSKFDTETLLAKSDIDPNKRAEALTLDEWVQLARVIRSS